SGPPLRTLRAVAQRGRAYAHPRRFLAVIRRAPGQRTAQRRSPVGRREPARRRSNWILPGLRGSRALLARGASREARLLAERRKAHRRLRRGGEGLHAHELLQYRTRVPRLPGRLESLQAG